MRNPIRTGGCGAARPIHYSLKRTCASRTAFGLLLSAALFCAGGCSESAPSNQESNGESNGGPSAEIEIAAAASGGSAMDAGGAQTSHPSDLAADAPAATLPTAPVIVFLGTSLTAGYGLEERQAFPALLQERIDEAGFDYQVVNAGVSGDTSAGGLRRLSWLLRLPISVLVLELGANDMLRGQGVGQLRSNLEAIVERTKEAHPDVRFVIAGMRAAPNLGRDYGEAFDAIYPALARRYDAALVPFLLEDVAARRNLNQADGIHPTAEGHALIAERLWKTLEPVLD